MVLILDLKNKIGYPVCAIIDSIEKDSSGIDRYYNMKYKTSNRNTWSSVKRTAQSLCIILTKEEQQQKSVADPLIFLSKEDFKCKPNKRLAVTTGGVSDTIIDL